MPAMAAGVTDRLWSVEELIEAVTNEERAEKQRGQEVIRD
jgi:hypothetical protein